MASIKKRPGSRLWVLCYKLPDGSRRQVSSRTDDPYRAYQMALKLEGSKPTGREWAERMVTEIAELAGIELVDKTPVSQLFIAYRCTRQRGWSESSKGGFLAIENGFLEWVGPACVGEMASSHIAGYRDHLLMIGRSARTVAWHIKYLRRVFKLAVDDGRLTANPAEGVTTPPMKTSAKRPFTLDQFRALLAATTGEWRLLILLAGLTGQRLQDCLDLKWENVDHAAGVIRFKRRKNDDIHTVPMHEDLRQALQDGAGWAIFPELGQLPRSGTKSVSAAFRKDVLPLIGIVQPYRRNTSGNRVVTTYSFHSLRHMLSTELNRAGVSAETRMLIVGHEDAKISKGYTHADLDTARAMISKVVI